jgi:hypothetical protein
MAGKKQKVVTNPKGVNLKVKSFNKKAAAFLT